jgi:hypothetical protein
MVIRKEIEINSSIENAWKVLGHDFAHPSRWASAVNHSEGQGKPIASIECDERACQTTMGRLREKLTHYSDKEFSLGYDITEGLPAFVKSGKNAWSLEKAGPQKTVLHMKMELVFKGWAKILAPLLQPKMSQAAQELGEDFAYYVEHGTPHPRKLKAQAKLEAPRRAGLGTFYLLAFLVGTFVPLYFVYGFIQESGGVNLPLFIAQLFENKASSTFSADLLICSFIFWVFMAYDKRSKNLPGIFYFIVLNLTIGLSSALPLYLYFRERAYQKQQRKATAATGQADYQFQSVS